MSDNSLCVDSKKRFILYGASGHGKVVADALYCDRQTVACFIDDDKLKTGHEFFGHSVIGFGEIGQFLASSCKVIVAIGDNQIRETLAVKLHGVGAAFGVVVHPRTVIAENTRIGSGTVLFAGVVINSDSRIGEHVIVNTSASVDHDCSVGDFSHIAPGVRLCGGVTIGRNVLVGAGSTVLPGINIGNGSVIGAGSVVIRDVPENSKMAGNPARELGKWI